MSDRLSPVKRQAAPSVSRSNEVWTIPPLMLLAGGGGNGQTIPRIAQRTEYNFAQPQIRFRMDNPGGEWLAQKQQLADAAYRRRGTVYSTLGTDTAGTNGIYANGAYASSPLPPSFLRQIPGAMNEKRQAGDPQYNTLRSLVRQMGWSNDDAGRVLIGVNHQGRPVVLEGNTRIAVAHDLGIPKINAEVRYFNGGELASGMTSPDQILQRMWESAQ